MLSVDKYLYRRSNGVYYYRYNFPSLFSKSSFEIICSLKTHDLNKGKTYALGLRMVVAQLITRFEVGMPEQLRRLSDSDYQRIVRDYIKECHLRMKVQIETANDFHTRLAVRAKAGEVIPDMDGIVWIDAKSYLCPDGFAYDGLDEALQNPNPQGANFPDIGSPNGFNEEENLRLPEPNDHQIISWLYRKHDICDYVSQGTSTYKTLKRSLVEPKKYLEFVQNAEKFGKTQNLSSYDDYLEAKQSFLRPQSTPRNNISAVLPPLNDKFSVVYKKYLDEEARKSKPSTITAKKYTYEQFQSIFGDMDFQAITKKVASSYKDKLMRLPKNMSKRYKGKAIDDVLKAEYHPDEKISNRTINKCLSEHMGALMNWARNNGYYEGDNPFSGLNIGKSASEDGQRNPYSDEQLIRLLETPVYQGCAGIKQTEYYKRGDLILSKSSRFWVPLIGLYTGARLGEICGLRVRDCKIKDDVLVFDINDGDTGKVLKTLQSKRLVPVHKVLLDLKFRELLLDKRGQNELLFPDLTLSRGSYGTNFSKNYGRFAKQFNISGDKDCFHSFRHNFADAIRLTKCPEAQSHYLTGHKQHASQQASYGRNAYKFEMKDLQKYVNTIEYPAIEEHINALKKKLDKTA